MLKDNFKGYRRQTLKIGEPIEIPTFKVMSYNMQLQLVTIHFPEKNVEMIVPFNFHPLDISPFGLAGYMQPDHLPFDHVGFIMGRKTNNIVTHRSSNEDKLLQLDRDFDLNGEFALSPVKNASGETKYYTSQQWTTKTLKAHLENFKGKEITSRGTIFGLMDGVSSKFNQSILLSRINKDRYVVFVLFENGVVYPFKITLLI